MAVSFVIATSLASRSAVQLALYLPALPFMVDFFLNERYYAELMYLSGLYSVQLLLLTLSVTPLRRCFHRLPAGAQKMLLPTMRWLIRFRRQFGIATFAYALIHAGIYIQYNVPLADILTEALDMELLVGWISLGILLILAMTSNDGSVNRLGSWWPRLHMVVHPVSLLVFIHWFLFEFFGYTIYVLAGILLLMQVVRVSISEKRT